MAQTGIPSDRHLDWDSCCNVRDLGGLRTVDGHQVRWRALIRSDSPHKLTSDGWSALRAHGVRTIIDLRNDDERATDVNRTESASDDVTVISLPLDGKENADFWGAWEMGSWDSGPQFGCTPLYYGPHLESMPERSARVLQAIAQAPPGGVMVHCVHGRDRTGLIIMSVLSLLGVAPDDIAADHALSQHRLLSGANAIGDKEFDRKVDEYLASKGMTASEVIISTLSSIDIKNLLQRGGLRDADIDALRARLLQ